MHQAFFSLLFCFLCFSVLFFEIFSPFFCNIFSSTHTPRHKKFFNHSITTKYQNGIFFNLLRVCRTTTKSLLREARERQQKESFGPNQSRFLRAFLLYYVLSFFMFIIFLISDLFYFFFLSANLFNLSTRITTNTKKRAKRTDARHSQPRSPAKA